MNITHHFYYLVKTLFQIQSQLEGQVKKESVGISGIFIVVRIMAGGFGSWLPKLKATEVKWELRI